MYDGVILKPDLDDVFDDSCFAHYGVKGMHWGVRKAIDSIGGAIKRRKNKIASIGSSIRRHENARTMSNVGKLMRAKNLGYTKTMFGVKGQGGENRWRYNSRIRKTIRTAIKNPTLEGREVFNKVIRSEHRKKKIGAFAADAARLSGGYAAGRMLGQLLWG